MFKNIGFDLRDKQGKYEIHFRIFNQKLMQVEYYRCGDEVFINEKKSENSDK